MFHRKVLVAWSSFVALNVPYAVEVPCALDIACYGAHNSISVLQVPTAGTHSWKRNQEETTSLVGSMTLAESLQTRNNRINILVPVSGIYVPKLTSGEYWGVVAIPKGIAAMPPIVVGGPRRRDYSALPAVFGLSHSRRH